MTESRRGRPRSGAVHGAILDAARALLTEGGYAELSMDRVAARAGVGKQTLYRRWPSKAPLVAEAVMDAYGKVASSTVPSTGDLAADLRRWLAGTAEFLAAPHNAALIRALAAAAAEDRSAGEALYRRLTGPQQEAVLQRLREGVLAGQVRANADLESVIEALAGAVLYRTLARPDTTGPGRNFNGLVDALVSGVVTGSDAAG